MLILMVTILVPCYMGASARVLANRSALLMATDQSQAWVLMSRAPQPVCWAHKSQVDFDPRASSYAKIKLQMLQLSSSTSKQL